LWFVYILQGLNTIVIILEQQTTLKEGEKNRKEGKVSTGDEQDFLN